MAGLNDPPYILNNKSNSRFEMGMLLNLAWRNIWRNKKRSFISIASVLFAVVVALGMRSMQVGSYRHMVHNAVSTFTGYFQIHAAGYWDKKSLDYSFVYRDSLADKVNSIKHIAYSAPRLECFALASSGNITDVAMVIGIDPETEHRMTKLADKMVQGEYLSRDDEGILLAEGMAKHLRMAPGDTVILLGQGYHGVTAAGKYRVKGVFKFPVPNLNTSLAYLSLREAQRFTWSEGRITSLAVVIDRVNRMPSVQAGLDACFDESYEVMPWQELLPELDQYIKTDDASGIIMLWIIYIVIGFGILGTVLMMTLERTREFGILTAIGMHSSRLRLVITLESVFLSIIGAIAGIIVGLPILIYLYYNPIRMGGTVGDSWEKFGFEPLLKFALDPNIFWWQTLVVVIIALVASLYPLWKVSRLKPVQAIRSG